MGNAGQANYSSGKAGVVGLTKTLAKEWGQFKINVNAVAFGYIETRLTASKDEDNVMEIGGETVQLGIPDQLRGMAAMLIPLGPPGHPRGGRRRRLLPLLAVVELRPRPGAQRHRRAVHGHDDVSTDTSSPSSGGRPRGSAPAPARLLRLLRGRSRPTRRCWRSARALIADPEREGCSSSRAGGGRRGRRLRDALLDLADAQRGPPRRHERPVRTPRRPRHRARRPRSSPPAASAAAEHGAGSLAWQTAKDNHRAQTVYDHIGGRRSEWLDYSLPVR